MELFQDLWIMDFQLIVIFASNVISAVSLSGVCPIYTYISYYLTFMQAMFMIKVNTSLGSTWWLNAGWCIVLYSYIVSSLFGIGEFLIQADMTDINYRIMNNKWFLYTLKIIYFSLFLVTAILMLSICDPNKCQ